MIQEVSSICPSRYGEVREMMPQARAPAPKRGGQLNDQKYQRPRIFLDANKSLLRSLPTLPEKLGNTILIPGR